MKIAVLIHDNREANRDYENNIPWFGTAPEALLQGFEDLPEVEVHVVSCAQKAMKSPAKLAPNIFFHSVVVPKIGWLRSAYQGCVRAVRRRLREIRPDIVHGQGSEREQNISAVLSGFPNVLTIHGNMRLIAKMHHSPLFSFLWLAAKLEGLTIPRADGVVCITDYTRLAVASLARKTWLVPNAVDRSFFDIDRRLSGSVKILCVATVEQRKNQLALIRAMDTLILPHNLELIFLGSANRKNPYVRTFFQLVEVRPWCRYVGFADRQAMRGYFGHASGLVLPSLEDNCPMAVLEAMAAGVPVAAAKVGGVPELIRHGETGWLFDPTDSGAIAVAMKKLLENPASEMASLARSEARTRFHPRVIAVRHLEIYREVLASRTGSNAPSIGRKALHHSRS